MRVVLDPNTLVSSLLSSGTTAAVVDAWINDDAYTPVVCPHLLEELSEVLARNKFQSIPDDVKRGLIERLGKNGEPVDDPQIEVGVTADPDDDYLVALVRTSQADVLVSGDPHLHHANIDDVVVLTPAEFLARLKK